MVSNKSFKNYCAVQASHTCHDPGTAFSRIEVGHKFRHADDLYAVMACERNKGQKNWLLVFDRTGNVILHDLQSGKMDPFQSRVEPGGTVIFFQKKAERSFLVWHIFSANRISRME